MTCVLCRHGHTRAGTTQVVLDRGGCTVVIKDVPAEVCENCGEYYLSETVSRTVLERADEAVRRGAEVEILRYAA